MAEKQSKRISWWKQTLWIPPAAFLLALPLFFTTLDHKLYDFFLYSLPPLTESPKVRVLTLDDDSYSLAGGYPFRREVMADVLILLKEFGAGSISFDIGYLDNSPIYLDFDYAKRVFSGHFDNGFGQINDAAVFLIDGFASGFIDKNESEFYIKEFEELSGGFRSVLEESLDIITRDVDEYFSQTMGLSNMSWLTLTMKSKDDMEDANTIPTDNETAEQLKRVALNNVTVLNDRRTPEAVYVMPAINKLLRRARGAGTTNAAIDADGVRRRVQLLFKYDGDYFGNLTLMGMSGLMDNSAITVSSNKIILEEALIDGVKKNITIPRNTDGSVLLKWPRKPFREYRQSSLVDFIQHTSIESHFAQNLSVMDASGFFGFWNDGENPRELYSAAENKKALLFEQYSDSVSEEWLSLRREFFSVTERFLSDGYEERILAAVSGDADTENFVKEIFSACRNQLFRMTEIRKKYADLEGSFCVVGINATGTTDFGTTPFEEKYPNVGTYAVMANMLLANEFIVEAPFLISVIIALIYSFAITFVVSRLSSGRSIIAGLCGLVLLAVMLLIYFHISKQYISALIPLVSTALSFATVTVTNFLSMNREKAFLHSAFSRYLSPLVINEIIANPDKLNLGGEKREMTAIFTDIKGFSTFSEQLDPTQLVKLLNKYLTAMSNIIMENSGTVDKYEGDAIIAFFGAPLYRDDHAALACASALAMKKAESVLNTQIIEEGLIKTPLFTRIGMNTGDMVVGNMGAENKMDYTIMGNAVNLTARLEGVNKVYRTGILISEYTREKAGDAFIFRKLDRVRVVGINTPIRLYELIERKEDADENLFNNIAKWEEALNLMERYQFADAVNLFSGLSQQDPQDSTAELYFQRCNEYLHNPPPYEWDGVVNLTEK